jgi:hypothetical protein
MVRIHTLTFNPNLALEFVDANDVYRKILNLAFHLAQTMVPLDARLWPFCPFVCPEFFSLDLADFKCLALN